MEDGVQYPFIRDPFLADHLDELPAQPFMAVTVFECSHIYVRAIRFLEISELPAKR
jgi:hypothetical protein